MEDPVDPLERNLYGHPLAGLVWERQFEKILLKYGWEKVSNWECLFVHREEGLFLSVYVDDIRLAGKKQNIDPMWKSTKQRSQLIWENQHHSLTMYTWDVLKDTVKQAKMLLTITEPCLNQEFPQEELKKLPCSENLSFSSWSYDMEGMPGNVWNDIVSWQAGQLNNSTKYQLHALMTIISKKKN